LINLYNQNIQYLSLLLRKSSVKIKAKSFADTMNSNFTKLTKLYTYRTAASVATSVERSLRVRKGAGSKPGWVKSKTEKMSQYASLVSVLHLKVSRAGWPSVSLMWLSGLSCGMILRCAGA